MQGNASGRRAWQAAGHHEVHGPDIEGAETEAPGPKMPDLRKKMSDRCDLRLQQQKTLCRLILGQNG